MSSNALPSLYVLLRKRSGLRGLLIGLSAVFALILIGGTFVVASLAGDMNNAAEVALRQTVRHVIDAKLEEMRRASYLTSHWNEGAIRLYGNLDKNWALYNITSDATIRRYSYVVDAKGETLFACRWDKTPAPLLRDSAPEAVTQLLAKLPKTQAEETRFRNGVGVIAQYRGRPAFVTASVLVPEDEAPRAALHYYRYLMNVEFLDRHTIDKWSRQFLVDGLAWSATPPTGSTLDAIPLDSGGDVKLGYLTWKRPFPGTDSVTRLVPLLSGVVICFLALTVAVAWAMLRSQMLQIASRREARRQARTARSAQDRAEAALAQAEESQERLRQLAQAQAEEQAAHQQALRAAARGIADEIDGLSSILAGQLQDAARGLEQGAIATLSSVRTQDIRVRDIRTRSREASAQLQTIMATVRTIGQSLAQVSAETMANRSLIETSADRSCAAYEATDAMRSQVAAIGEAATAITGLTTRTRMLALNATIEAAKAGEAGAGFAVVAGEVKALATQTDQLNRSIHQRLAAIMDGARSTSDLSDGLRTALTELSQASLQTFQVVNEQCAATQQVQAASTGIDGYADIVGESIDDLGTMFNQVSTQANETRSRAETVLTASDQLQESLRNLVSKLRAA